MATVPLSGNTIKLISGVPFSNDYKHTRWHTSSDAQIAYFNSSAVNVVHVIATATFQRMDNKSFIRVDKSIDEIFNVNYLRFQNTAYNSKWFYAFVTKLEYVQRNTTYIHFEIDVIQTWMFDYNFKPSFVIREHTKLWNEDGSPVVNTVDEGLNYGTEYDTVSFSQYTPKNNIYFLVIVSKSTLHETPTYIRPSVIGMPQPLTYYLHPFKLNGGAVTVATAGGASTTGTNTLFDVPQLTDILTNLYTVPSAVDEIVSLYITEHCGLDAVWNTTLNALDLQTAIMEKVQIGGLNTIYVTKTWVSPNYGFSPDTEFDCSDKYTGYEAPHPYIPNSSVSFYEESTAPTDGDSATSRVGLETKLLMYPYAYTSLEDNKGNHIILRNEYINNSKLLIKVYGSMGLSNKVAYIPYQYSNDNLLFSEALSSYEYALINDSPMDVTIINEFLAAYLQGHRNSLKNKADTIAFDGATSMANGLIGFASSAVSKNPIGSASSAISVARGAGDAVLQMQGMMAQIKDARNTPPSLQKMGSNTAFDFGNHFNGFFVKKKQIKPEYQKKLSQFFKLYGYKINEVKIPNFYTRQNWNYVQTNSCVITGSFNAEDLNDIKSVFDGGITLWHTDDVGNYFLKNLDVGAEVLPSDTTAPVITISVPTGTYNTPKTVTLTSNETATIYYTLDGVPPTTSSAVYSGSIFIPVSGSPVTIKYFGKDVAGNSSSIQTAIYTFDVIPPIVSISPSPATTYTTTQSVTFSANEATTVYYTLDGSTPTTSSSVYSTAITVTEGTTTIKFFGKDTAGNSSSVSTAAYTIDSNIYFFSDTFDRANSATSLGTSTSGHVWNPVSGTWGISSNEAYSITLVSLEHAITPSLGTNNYTITCYVKGQTTTAGSGIQSMPGIIFGYVSSTNYKHLQIWANQIAITDRSGNALSSWISISGLVTDGVYNQVKIVCSSSDIKVYWDSVLKITYGSPSGGDKVGMRIDKSGSPTYSARWNNFNVYRSPSDTTLSAWYVPASYGGFITVANATSFLASDLSPAVAKKSYAVSWSSGAYSQMLFFMIPATTTVNVYQQPGDTYWHAKTTTSGVYSRYLNIGSGAAVNDLDYTFAPVAGSVVIRQLDTTTGAIIAIL